MSKLVAIITPNGTSTKSVCCLTSNFSVFLFVVLRLGLTSFFDTLHRSANNGFVFVVEKLWIISGVIFDVESESGIRISLSRQDFEIFEVMYRAQEIFLIFFSNDII